MEVPIRSRFVGRFCESSDDDEEYYFNRQGQARPVALNCQLHLNGELDLGAEVEFGIAPSRERDYDRGHLREQPSFSRGRHWLQWLDSKTVGMMMRR